MAKNIGKSFNTTDKAVLLPHVLVGSSVSTTLLPARNEGDPVLIEVNITPKGASALWVKRQAASIDNDKKGIRIPGGETKAVVIDGSYSGEISGIYESGPDRQVVVEYY